MSKRELTKYIKSLSKKQLEEQIFDLYIKFKPVKEYYNFVFNPNEEKLILECKFKINKEYFPTSNRKPKKRRSIAQKYIKKFITLGVDPILIADVMLFNIETAQKFEENNNVQESFYKSIYKSFDDANTFINENSLKITFYDRIINIIDHTENYNWINNFAFQKHAI